MATATMSDPEIFSPAQGPDDSIPQGGGALGVLEESTLRTLVDLATKPGHARSITKFMQELDELVTQSPEIAQQMTYSLPRGDGQKIGPSIRFAESVQYCWRNLFIQIMPFEVGTDTVTARAQIFDLERLQRFSWDTSRNITGKYGRFNQDMIGVTMKAASSIAYRDAILKYIPRALWIGAWEKSKLASVGKIEAIGQKRIEALQYFNKAGITNVQVFNALGVSGVEDIDVDNLVTLKAWARELKDGQKSVEEIFGTPFDDEIERTMKALGWNETKKRMSRENFAGNPQAHLNYLRGEAKKMDITVEMPKEQQPAQEQPAQATAPAQQTAPVQQQSTPPPQAEQPKPQQTAAKTPDW